MRFESQCAEGYANYLKGKYYGVLKDCEKKKDFSLLLDSILIDLTGFLENYDSINLYRLYAKTASLKYLKYQYFRDTILGDCMSLIDSIFKEV